MIYQELNLPVWAQVIVVVIAIVFGIYIATIEPTEEAPESLTEAPKEVKEQIPHNAVKERYGAYIQAQGHYYN